MFLVRKAQCFTELNRLNIPFDEKLPSCNSLLQVLDQQTYPLDSWIGEPTFQMLEKIDDRCLNSNERKFTKRFLCNTFVAATECRTLIDDYLVRWMRKYPSFSSWFEVLKCICYGNHPPLDFIFWILEISRPIGKVTEISSKRFIRNESERLMVLEFAKSVIRNKISTNPNNLLRCLLEMRDLQATLEYLPQCFRILDQKLQQVAILLHRHSYDPQLCNLIENWLLSSMTMDDGVPKAPTFYLFWNLLNSEEFPKKMRIANVKKILRFGRVVGCGSNFNSNKLAALKLIIHVIEERKRFLFYFHYFFHYFFHYYF